MNDVIDITDLVEKARSTFVDWGVAYLFGQEIAIPGLQWVALPIIADLDKAIIRMILDSISKSAVMQAFFLNTSIRKASQAHDYVDAVNYKNSLPEDVSDADYEKAEQAEIAAFAAFVSFTN